MTVDLVYPLLVNIQSTLSAVEKRMDSMEMRMAQIEHKMVDLHLGIQRLLARTTEGAECGCGS